MKTMTILETIKKEYKTETYCGIMESLIDIDIQDWQHGIENELDDVATGAIKEFCTTDIIGNLKDLLDSTDIEEFFQSFRFDLLDEFYQEIIVYEYNIANDKAKTEKKEELI